uniref:BED-type domain-containing protein n=1 Tax=Meloidogyne enterolobii TaxID=390850 RepID=A0A6V7VLF4_MELEN|nr:unnamed protein product [Meloidogyne enterolobii]
MSSSTPFKSQVWKYFEIFNKDNGERYVRCGICSGEYKFPKEYTSTTFKRHLDGHVKSMNKIKRIMFTFENISKSFNQKVLKGISGRFPKFLISKRN